MNKILDNPADVEAISVFVANNLSWKRLFYDKFSLKQKILYFMPAIFFLLLVYGMWALFFLDFQSVFIVIGILFLLLIALVFKQKTIYEKKVFEKEYRSPACTDIKNFTLAKFTNFLGTCNTAENRVLWLDYYQKETRNKQKWIMLIVILLPSIFVVWNKPDSIIFIISLIILAAMADLIILPATRYQFSAKIYNQVIYLINEINDEE